MKVKVLAVAASLAVSAVLIAFGILFRSSRVGIGTHTILLFSIAAAIPMLSYGSLDYIEVQKIYQAEKRLPDLLRDLSNYSSFGIPLSEAFQRIGQNSYGVLTSGVRRVSSLVGAGVDFDNAIRELGAGIRSSKIAMVSKILQKSNESGSNTSDVIWILSEFTTRSELMRGSRIADMKNYNLVMIISFGVFLFVILFLDLRFLHVMLQHSITNGSFVSGNLSAKMIENTFTIGVLVQAVAIGMISGVLRDVRISSGLFLSGVLVAVTILIFSVLGVL